MRGMRAWWKVSKTGGGKWRRSGKSGVRSLSNWAAWFFVEFIPMRRVVVTGIGVISALGLNGADFWQALCQGRSGIGPIETVDRTRLRFENGAEVRGYRPAEYFDEKTLMFLDRFAQFAVIAAREAVRDAHLEWTEDLREQGAVVTGSCTGGQTYEDAGFVDLYVQQRNRVHPLTVPRIMANAGASHISMEFGIKG